MRALLDHDPRADLAGEQLEEHAGAEIRTSLEPGVGLLDRVLRLPGIGAGEQGSDKGSSVNRSRKRPLMRARTIPQYQPQPKLISTICRPGMQVSRIDHTEVTGLHGQSLDMIV